MHVPCEREKKAKEKHWKCRHNDCWMCYQIIKETMHFFSGHFMHKKPSIISTSSYSSISVVIFLELLLRKKNGTDKTVTECTTLSTGMPSKSARWLQCVLLSNHSFCFFVHINWLVSFTWHKQIGDGIKQMKNAPKHQPTSNQRDSFPWKYEHQF